MPVFSSLNALLPLIYFRYTTKMSILSFLRVGRCPNTWRAFVLVTQLISGDQVDCWFTKAKVCHFEIHRESERSYEATAVRERKK